MIPENNLAYLQSAVDADVRKAYSAMLKQRKINDIERIMNLTGMRPKFADEDIQNAYVEILEKGGIEDVDAEYVRNFHIESSMSSAAKLKKLTGVKPRAGTTERIKGSLQELYGHYMICGYIEEAVGLKELTGIGPQMDEEMERKVQIGHSRCISNGYWAGAVKLKKLTGAAPEMNRLMKARVQVMYGACFELIAERDDKETYIKLARKMKKATGIAPSKKLLKKYPQYAEMLK